MKKQTSKKAQKPPLNKGDVSRRSDTQRYRMLGNGWTVDVVAHILTFYNFEKIEESVGKKTFKK